MEITLLYRDQSIVLCEKPIGISSEHPGRPDLISQQIQAPVYPVHRLDQGTGGVCALALSGKCCARMQQLFQSDSVRKEYDAVFSGIPSGDDGVMTDFLYHDPGKNKSFVVRSERRGVRRAECEWKLIETAEFEGEKLSWIRVTLHTGRTHQIRVQFSSRGMPLVGDRKYGSRIRASSPALWSARLCFPHPEADRIVDISSRPPEVFPWSEFRRP